MQSTDWAPAHSEALREYLGKGMSYSEIADAINAKFKTAYSRSAAIGRATRMGLGGHARPEDRPRPPLRAKPPLLRILRERYTAEFMRPMPVLERARRRSNCAALKSIRAIFPWSSLNAAIAAILTAATPTAKPSPFAVIPGARVQATARRIFV